MEYFLTGRSMVYDNVSVMKNATIFLQCNINLRVFMLKIIEFTSMEIMVPVIGENGYFYVFRNRFEQHQRFQPDIIIYNID